VFISRVFTLRGLIEVIDIIYEQVFSELQNLTIFIALILLRKESLLRAGILKSNVW